MTTTEPTTDTLSASQVKRLVDVMDQLDAIREEVGEILCSYGDRPDPVVAAQQREVQS